MRTRSVQLALTLLLLVALIVICVSLYELIFGTARSNEYIFALIVSVFIAAAASYSRSIIYRIHPAIRRYSIVTLNPAEIKRAVDEGRAFPLPLGRRTVNVLVRAEPVFDQSEIIEDLGNGETVRRRLQENIAYAGELVDEKGKNHVRLTITEDWLTGYCLDSKGWWFIEPLKTFRADAALTDYLVYRTKDLRFKMDVSDDIIPKMVEQFSPGDLPPGSAYLPSSPSSPSSSSSPSAHKVGPGIGMVVVADCEYNTQAKWTGASWYAQQISVINNINGLYNNNIGCWFIPKYFMLNYKGLNNCKAELLLQDLESVVKGTFGDLRVVKTRVDTGIEVAHLTSGKNLDGNTLGIAWQPGVYSLSQQQLIWIGGGGGFGGPPNFAFQNMMLMAHELGHNFGGDHAEADEWCVAEFIWCWDYERSLMWPTFHDDNNAWISDGSRDPKHNNRQRMANNMANLRSFHL